MKNKRIYIFGLIIIFCLVLISLLFITFNVRKVDVTFSCAENEPETLEIQEDLDKLKGKNLFFLSREKVIDLLNEYPFFELESFNKKFPSSIEISVKERHKAYFLNKDGKKYLLSDEGIVLADNVTDTSNLIEIDTATKAGYYDIEISSLEVGKKIGTSCDDIFSAVFKISSSVDLTDRIESVSIFYNKLMFNIEYLTHTKAVLHISEANDNGVEKANLLFAYYDDIEKDYEKMQNDKYYFYIDKNLNPGFKYKG